MRPKIIYLSLFYFIFISLFADNFSSTGYNVDNITIITDTNKEKIITMDSQDSLLFAGYSDHFNVVYKEGVGFAALDNSGNILFTIFPYDNGPDYPSEGLFRIIENGKIGFADLTGAIVIEPAYDAAMPFQEGLAAFCVGCKIITDGEHKSWSGGKWGFINKKGEVVIQPQFEKIISGFNNGYAEVAAGETTIKIDKSGKQIENGNMNYYKWVELLSGAIQLNCKTSFNDKVIVELTWSENGDGHNYILSNSPLLEVIIILPGDSKPAIKYYIIPWQNFSVKKSDANSQVLIDDNQLITVTDYAVIYKTYSYGELTKDEKESLNEFEKMFNNLIELETNQTPEKDEVLNIPEDIQLISINSFANYFELNVALPGSMIPEQKRWSLVSEFKMLHLIITPESGIVKEMWVKPVAELSVGYRQNENELLDIFEEAIKESTDKPELKNKIYQAHKNALSELFSNAESYSGFLNYKYSDLLSKWLMITEEPNTARVYDEPFPDYQRKITPDTAADFMPAIAGELAQLPAAEIDNLVELYNLLKDYQKEAFVKPGNWVEGNIVLGAKEKEYQPSRSELLASEVGDRLQTIISKEDKKTIRQIFDNAKIKPGSHEYTQYSFIHFDVMGSGRFFYVDEIKNVKLIF